MIDFLFVVITQSIPFLALAFGISVSYNILKATDMTIDGSFVIGAAVFAKLVTMGMSPIIAMCAALIAGALSGMMAALIQRGGRVDSLLAGVLATFILSSINLGVMGKPNINLLSQPTLVSAAFEHSELYGWILSGILVALLCSVAFLLLQSRLGLRLRAFGDNPTLFKRMGHSIELYRLGGFALTNMLAAGAGCFTAQTVGYADIGMGFGMTLTGIGAIILGQQILCRFYKRSYFRLGAEFGACLIGVIVYFFALNLLLRLDINPIYFKLILGLILVVFLRAALNNQTAGNLS